LPALFEPPASDNGARKNARVAWLLPGFAVAQQPHRVEDGHQAAHRLDGALTALPVGVQASACKVVFAA